MEKEKIKELDFFRAIAAVLVLLYHYTTRYNISFGHIKTPYYLDVSFGCMGVSIFFILCGFLSILKINSQKSAKKFLVKRLIRLYPAYLISMFLTSLIIALAGEKFNDRCVSMKDWFINLTMVPSYFGAKPIDGVYWTLGIEIIFYVLVAVIITSKKQNNIEKLSLIWIVVSVITNTLLVYNKNSILKALRILCITEHSQLFIIGIIMKLLYKKENTKLSYIIILLCFINQYIALGINYTVFVLIFTIIFYIIIVKKIRISKKANNYFIAFIAKISYPLYLTHQFIGSVIINKLEKLGFINEFYILIPIAISIGIAYLINKAELYIRNILNNKLKI